MNASAALDSGRTGAVTRPEEAVYVTYAPIAMSHASRGGRARQLVIGIDAMEWQLVRRWASAGTLPTFRRLLERGAHAELSTTAAQLPDTVWASIYTGMNPAKFEKYFYVQYDPATMGLRMVPDDAITTPPFWKLLSDAGVRVGVADAPKFPVSAPLNGFQISNWGAHATKTARTSYPKGLIDEVDGKIGRHPVGECDMVDEKPAQLAALRDRIVEGVHRHGELFRWLMRREPWDVFFAGFSGAHCIGHHFWRFADDAHPLHPPDDPHGLKPAIEQTYRALDEEIGAMSELAGPEARFMVVSGHGMGPIHHASWNLPEILEGLGYGREPPRRAAALTETREGATNPWRILKMVLPGKLQYAIKSRLPQSLQNQLLFLWYRSRQSWRGCRAFAVPNNDSVGAIRISVIGRDKDGLVAPGAEYERICQDIASALRELTDPVTGRPVVKRATLSSEEFSGPFLAQLPDITVLWDQSFAWNAIQSPRLGTLRIRRQDARTGSHTPRGFVLIEGPGVPAGLALGEQSIYDIAPTILDAVGVPIPAHCDGRPLPIAH